MFKHKHEVHKKYKDHNKSHYIALISLMVLVFCMVAAVSYATYLFVGALRIPSVSKMHFTKNFSLALQEMRGELYSNEKLGIKDWIVFSDNQNGFQLKYPNDWEKQKKENNLFFLKRYVSDNPKVKSLDATMEIGKLELGEKENLKMIVEKKGIKWNPDWKEEVLAGRLGLRTGKVKTENGPIKDIVFWKNEQKKELFYFEATYFTDKSLLCENIFDKMIVEFKFL